MRFHIGWRRERNVLYKSVETSRFRREVDCEISHLLERGTEHFLLECEN